MPRFNNREFKLGHYSPKHSRTRKKRGLRAPGLETQNLRQ